MHNLFEPAIATEIIERLGKVQSTTQPQWGRMNAAQMMAHCQAPFEVFFGGLKLKRGIVSYLFGRMAKRKLFSDKPWPKGLPTAKEFVVADQREFEKERDQLVSLIRRFSAEGAALPESVHPFFGKMTTEEWALLAYKHLDHHLQQFGA